jgi:hypothetical protein
MKDFFIWLRETDSIIARIALVLFCTAAGLVWIFSIANAAAYGNPTLALLVLVGGPVALLYFAYWRDHMVKK